MILSNNSFLILEAQQPLAYTSNTAPSGGSPRIVHYTKPNREINPKISKPIALVTGTQTGVSTVSPEMYKKTYEMMEPVEKVSFFL